MRIPTSNPGGMAVQQVADSGAADGAEAAAAPAPASAPAPLQSAVMQPALQAMREMPEIDQEKVDMLRDALAKGELPFDPAKLAGLIQRFHGSEQ
ncbi:flagellar biosynthesis anti-sigma factor FlgM [Duganella sp. CT11-25]|jgi:negative regulator of flagellin synthesis FlgM|uniref:flagellar biosynthesis anti-sigma factor FlgM n=1 Tax=unclassified Duganella TaxID=2636909 RepID=UPI0039B11C80